MDVSAGYTHKRLPTTLSTGLETNSVFFLCLIIVWLQWSISKIRCDASVFILWSKILNNDLLQISEILLLFKVTPFLFRYFKI